MIWLIERPIRLVGRTIQPIVRPIGLFKICRLNSLMTDWFIRRSTHSFFKPIGLFSQFLSPAFVLQKTHCSHPFHLFRRRLTSFIFELFIHHILRKNCLFLSLFDLSNRGLFSSDPPSICQCYKRKYGMERQFLLWGWTIRSSAQRGWLG